MWPGTATVGSSRGFVRGCGHDLAIVTWHAQREVERGSACLRGEQIARRLGRSCQGHHLLWRGRHQRATDAILCGDLRPMRASRTAARVKRSHARATCQRPSRARAEGTATATDPHGVSCERSRPLHSVNTAHPSEGLVAGARVGDIRQGRDLLSHLLSGARVADGLELNDETRVEILGGKR